MDRRQFTSSLVVALSALAARPASARADAVGPDALFDRLEAFGYSGGAVLVEDGLIEGHLYLHMGDDARFRAQASPT